MGQGMFRPCVSPASSLGAGVAHAPLLERTKASDPELAGGWGWQGPVVCCRELASATPAQRPSVPQTVPACRQWVQGAGSSAHQCMPSPRGPSLLPPPGTLAPITGWLRGGRWIVPCVLTDCNGCSTVLRLLLGSAWRLPPDVRRGRQGAEGPLFLSSTFSGPLPFSPFPELWGHWSMPLSPAYTSIY